MTFIHIWRASIEHWTGKPEVPCSILTWAKKLSINKTLFLKIIELDLSNDNSRPTNCKYLPTPQSPKTDMVYVHNTFCVKLCCQTEIILSQSQLLHQFQNTIWLLCWCVVRGVILVKSFYARRPLYTPFLPLGSRLPTSLPHTYLDRIGLSGHFRIFYDNWSRFRLKWILHFTFEIPIYLYIVTPFIPGEVGRGNQWHYEPTSSIDILFRLFYIHHI